MVDDYNTERLVKNYARENNYTLVANTPGTLEFVKYDEGVSRMIIMKWPRGCSSIIVKSPNGGESRIPVDTLKVSC